MNRSRNELTRGSRLDNSWSTESLGHQGHLRADGSDACMTLLLITNIAFGEALYGAILKA